MIGAGDHIPAKVTISRLYNNTTDDPDVTIEVKDEVALVPVIKVTMKLSAFAKALFGQAFLDAEYEVRSEPHKWGMTREQHTEKIKLPDGMYQKDEIREFLTSGVLDQAIAEGWVPQISSALSSQQPHGYINVQCLRWVYPDED